VEKKKKEGKKEEKLKQKGRGRSHGHTYSTSPVTPRKEKREKGRGRRNQKNSKGAGIFYDGRVSLYLLEEKEKKRHARERGGNTQLRLFHVRRSGNIAFHPVTI